MISSNRSAVTRRAAVWVALCLVVIAVALGIYAIDAGNAASLARSFTLPGSPPPDTTAYDAASRGALGEAVIALAVGGAVVVLRVRPVFAIAAIWAVLALGTGAWISLGAEPLPASIQVGPVELSMAVVGLGLALAAALCLGGCVVGWLASPAEPAPARPHMPPPTHQR